MFELFVCASWFTHPSPSSLVLCSFHLPCLVAAKGGFQRDSRSFCPEHAVHVDAVKQIATPVLDQAGQQ